MFPESLSMDYKGQKTVDSERSPGQSIVSSQLPPGLGNHDMKVKEISGQTKKRDCLSFALHSL